MQNPHDQDTAPEAQDRAQVADSDPAAAAPATYIYRWNRQGRKGQRCEVTARGTMNSCCVRFADGYQMVTSRNALKRAASDHAA